MAYLYLVMCVYIYVKNLHKKIYPKYFKRKNILKTFKNDQNNVKRFEIIIIPLNLQNEGKNHIV